MTLEELIAKVPPNLNWLLRSCEDGRFFAHVFSSTFILSDGNVGFSSKGFAMSPADALAEVLERVK